MIPLLVDHTLSVNGVDHLAKLNQMFLIHFLILYQHNFAYLAIHLSNNYYIVKQSQDQVQPSDLLFESSRHVSQTRVTDTGPTRDYNV